SMAVQAILGAFLAALQSSVSFGSTGSTDSSGSSTREEDGRASCTTKVLLANDKTFFSYGMDTPGNVVC
ncbi:MAG: hypothetical protein ACLU6V_05265, partial [Lancefieldella rimae]